MKIFWSEIRDLDQNLEFTEAQDWVAKTIAASDELAPLKSSVAKAPKPLPAHLDLNLRKVDEVAVINGNLSASLNMICSRCAAPFVHSFDHNFSALFCKDPLLAGEGESHGFARHAHDESNASQDIDITYLHGETIDLSDVLHEQVQLQIPFQPLCKEDCKGICITCGTDFNFGKCACAKMNKTSPFSKLAALKL